MVEVTLNRQATILQELDSRFSRTKREHGGISANEYAEQRSIHRNTAKGRLDKLVKEGLMYSEWCEKEKGEKGNGETVYYLLEEADNTLTIEIKESIK